MQEPAGSTIARAMMGVDVVRNRAETGAEANVRANAIAIPRIFPPPFADVQQKEEILSIVRPCVSESFRQ
jgi:hypothetical protein